MSRTPGYHKRNIRQTISDRRTQASRHAWTIEPLLQSMLSPQSTACRLSGCQRVHPALPAATWPTDCQAAGCAVRCSSQRHRNPRLLMRDAARQG